MKVLEGKSVLGMDGEVRKLQTGLLNAALPRLDAFCRALILKDGGICHGGRCTLSDVCSKDSNQAITWKMGETGGDTWLCAALCDLARYTYGEEETAIKTASDELGTQPPSRERLRDIFQHLYIGENDNRVFFECCANLIAEIVGLSPCVTRRYHGNVSKVPAVSRHTTLIKSTGNGEEEHTSGSVEASLKAVTATAKSALHLPSIPTIKAVQHQLGRFPYGLLTVAVARDESLSKAVDSFDGNTHLEYQGTWKCSLETFVPAVLVVSPFYAISSQKKNYSQRVPVRGEGDCYLGEGNASDVRRILGLSFPGVAANMQSYSSEEHGTSLVPFPTTFWLSDPYLRRRISQLEKSGCIKELEETLHGGEALKTVIEDNVRFIALRWMLIPKVLLSHFYLASDTLSLDCSSDIMNPQYESSTCAAKLLESGLTNDIPVLRRITHNDPKGTCGSCDIGNTYDTSGCCRSDNAYIPRLCTCGLCKLLHSLRDRGIGGIAEFIHVRCLHMQYALHLLVPTVVGNEIDKLLHEYR